jgi:Bacterial antitoxin of type II TA system, VapB
VDRTNIVLDDDLIKRAMQVAGAKTKRQAGDCLGRKRARNLALDAVNHEINGVPGGPLNLDTHGNFPHPWPTICMALRTVVDHQVPADQVAACA